MYIVRDSVNKRIGLLVSVDGGHGVVGLAPGEDPGVGTLEDGGQAPPDKAEGLVLGPTILPGEGSSEAPHHIPRHLPPATIALHHQGEEGEALGLAGLLGPPHLAVVGEDDGVSRRLGSPDHGGHLAGVDHRHIQSRVPPPGKVGFLLFI